MDKFEIDSPKVHIEALRKLSLSKQAGDLVGRFDDLIDNAILSDRYDVAKQQLTCKDRTATLKPVDGKIRLRVLVDRTSIDIFGNDGLLYMPIGIIVPQDKPSVEIYAKGGDATLGSLELHELKSAWAQ